MTEPTAAAIVVLGAAVLPDGRPSPALARRIAHAAGLWREGATVIASGGRGESRAIRDGLVAAGVAAGAILVEDRSRSTFENALNAIALMRARGLGRAVVVTDAYHQPRALLTFRLLGVAATGSGPRGRAGTPRWKWALAHLREAAALPAYLVRGLARRVSGDPARR